MFKGSWRTTSVGIAGLLALIGGAAKLVLDGDPSTNPDWNAVIPAGLALIGSLVARDNKVSSEEAGAK